MRRIHRPELQLYLNRLEDRRVLSVTADFNLGQLSIGVTGEDTATVANDGAQITVRDADGLQIGDSLAASGVQSILVAGSAGADSQAVRFTGQAFTLPKGLTVDSKVESAAFDAPITGVTAAPIAINAAEVNLGADLATVRQDINIKGSLTVTAFVELDPGVATTNLGSGPGLYDFYDIGAPGGDVVLSPAGASPSTICVDDSWNNSAFGDDPDGTGPARWFGVDSFSTIQEGIDAAADGGTVTVAPGVYAESLTIAKNGLIVQSTDGATSTVITPPDTTVGGIFITGDSNTFDGFTVHDETDDGYESKIVRIHNGADYNNVTNNIIQGNLGRSDVVDPTDYGILCYGSYNLIEGNEIFDIGYIGVNIVGSPHSPASGNTIRTNDIHDIGIYAIALDRSPGNEVSRNEIADVVGGQLWGYYYDPAAWCWGIIVWGEAADGNVITNQTVSGLPNGIILSSAHSTVIQDSTVSKNTGIGIKISKSSWAGGIPEGNEIRNSFVEGNDIGVLVNGNPGDIGLGNRVVGNSILGNATANLSNASPVVIDASTNWWGSSQDNVVSASIVGTADFTPLLADGIDLDEATPGFQGDYSTLIVTSQRGQTGPIGRIQEGINLVTFGGTVNVLGGSYNGNVDTSNTSVTLAAGAGPARVISTGSFTLDGNDTLAIELHGTVAGHEYDQWVVTGDVMLGGATLDVSLGFTPVPEDTFTIIENVSGDGVHSEFSGLVDGATLLVDGVPLEIDYGVDAGNDIVLSYDVTPVLSADTLGVGIDNTIEVRLDAGGNIEVEIDGTVVLDTPSGNLITLTINGQTGNDFLTVDFSGGAPVPSGGMIFHGDSETNAKGDGLLVTGGSGFDSVTYNATGVGAGNLNLDGATVFFTGLEPIDVAPVAGTVTINIDPDGVVSGTINSELTNDVVAGKSKISFDNGLENMTFSNPTIALVINGDIDSDDAIKFSSLDPGFRAAITVDGRGGDDKIELNTNLTLGSATSSGNVDITAETIKVSKQVDTTGGIDGSVTFTASVLLDVNANGDFNLGGTFLQDGAGTVELSGDITTTDSDITFTSAVVLTANVALSTGTGGGDIKFNSEVNDDGGLSNRNLTLTAGTGQIDFLSTVGAGTPLNGLLVNSAATLNFDDTVAVAGGGIDITAGAVSFDQAVTTTGGGSVRIDNSGQLAIAAAADMDLDGSFAQIGSGPVSTAGDITTTDDPIGFAAEVTLSGDVELDTGSGAGDITFSSNVQGVYLLTLSAGAGQIDFLSTVGAGTPLNGLLVNSAATLNFDDTVAVAGGGIDITAGAVSFDQAVTTTGGGSVLIDNSGQLTIAAAADMDLDGSFAQIGSGLVSTAGDITTTDDPIRFAAEVTLSGDVELDTASGAGDITFSSNVQGVYLLTLSAGAGQIDFLSTVGAGTPLNGLLVNSAATLNFDDTVAVAGGGIDITAGAVSFDQAVTTTGGGSVRIDNSGQLTIAAAADMDLDGSFAQIGSGPVSTAGDIITTDDSIRFAAEVTLSGDVELDTGSGAGDITFDNALEGTTDFAQSVTLAAGTGNISFGGVVGGSTDVGDVVINSARDVTSAADFRVNSLVQVTGTGTTTFNGPVRVESASGVDLTTNEIVLNSPVDTTASSGPVRGTATGDIAVNGQITTGAGTVTLLANGNVTISPDGVILTEDADVEITAGSTPGSGGSLTMSDGALIDVGEASIRLTADGNIILGGLMTTGSTDGAVTLTSVSGGIVDGGDTHIDVHAPNSRLVIDAAAGVGDTAVAGAADAAIETTVASLDVDSGSSGDIAIDEADDVSVQRLFNATTSDGNGSTGTVRLMSGGSMTVDGDGVSAVDGDILLDAGASVTNNLDVNAPVLNLDGEGGIHLVAGQDLVITDTSADIDIGIDGRVGRIVGFAGRDVIIAPGTVIQTGTGSLEAIAESGEIDPGVELVPVDQGGSNLDSLGNAIIEVTITAPVGENFEIVIDWSDETIRYTHPQGDPDGQFVNGQTYTFAHTYKANPDPVDPSKPIPVHVTVAFDGRVPASNVDPRMDNGIAFYRNGGEFIETTVSDELTVPGEGVFSFIKVIKSEIEPVELRSTRSDLLVTSQAGTVSLQSERLEMEATELEYAAQSPARLFLRRVASGGKEGEDVELPIKLLEEGMMDAFSRLPNGRYRVYYQEPNSERVRMVREIHVHQGRVVPPDFREDVGERQPGGKQMSNTPEDATMDETDQNQGDAVEKDGLQIPPPATAEPADPTSGAEAPATYGTIHPAATMAVIGIAALDQRQRWSEQVDHAYQAGQRRLTRAARLCRRLRRDKTESQL